MTEVYDGHSGPFSWRSKSQEDLRIFESPPTNYIEDVRRNRNKISRMVLRPNPFVVEGTALDSGCPSSQESPQSSVDDIHLAASDPKINQNKLQTSLLEGLVKYQVSKNNGHKQIETDEHDTSHVSHTETVEKTESETPSRSKKGAKHSPLKQTYEHVNAAFVESSENLQLVTPNYESDVNSLANSIANSDANSSIPDSVTHEHSGHGYAHTCHREADESNVHVRDDSHIRYGVDVEVDDSSEFDKVLSDEEDKSLLDPDNESAIPQTGFAFLDNW